MTEIEMPENSPSPEALDAAVALLRTLDADHITEVRPASCTLAVKILARALDEFARQAVERDRLQRATELQRVLGDPRVGVCVPPADWGYPQNLNYTPAYTKGKR